MYKLFDTTLADNGLRRAANKLAACNSLNLDLFRDWPPAYVEVRGSRYAAPH